MSIRLGWREQPISGVSIWSSLMDEESAKLRELASGYVKPWGQQVRGMHVLEIGAAFGFSTSTLASVAEHVWSVDPHNIVPAWGLFGIESPDTMDRYRAGTLPVLQENLEAAGLADKVTICVGYSQSLLASDAPLSLELEGKIDLAFIDGDHSVPACLSDLINCARIVGSGGVLAVHDYDEVNNPGVKVAVDQWREDHSFELVGTLAVIRL